MFANFIRLVVMVLIHLDRQAFCVTESPSVKNDLGTILGLTNSVDVNGNLVTVKRFLGIPYAKPPVGDLRFRKPEPIEKLQSPFKATDFGSACYQIEVQPLILYETLSEDCLFLNVFVPDKEPDLPSGHAVMFFIHGGGFAYGSGRLYNGDTIAAHGNVIVVTINYRLSALGFLNSGDRNAPGNAGLWDQHVALQWVNKYIESFGGNKDRVTVFGESAGSVSTMHQAFFPANRGLVHRVIAQSGMPALKVFLSADPSSFLNYFANEFSCDTSTSKTIIDCLKGVDAEEMYKKTQKAVMKNGQKMFEVTPLPSVDGELIRMHPDELLKSDTYELKEVKFYRSLDVIIGFNSEEGAGLSKFLLNVTDDEEGRPTKKEMDTKLVDFGLRAAFGGNVSDLVRKLVLAEYTDWSNPDDPKSIYKEFGRLLGDVFTKYLSVDFSNLHSKPPGGGSTYLYHFDVKPSFGTYDRASWSKGASHADDLQFVFGFDPQFIQEAEKLFNVKLPVPESWEYDVSQMIMRYWTNFAKTGNPNMMDSQDSFWEQYDIAQKKCLDIKKEQKDTVVKKDMFAREENFWLHIIPKAMQACKNAYKYPFVGKPENACSAESSCGNN